MSTTKSNTIGSKSADHSPEIRRLYRIAGMAALLIVAAWIAQPILVLSAAGNAGKTGTEAFPVVQDLLHNRWSGPVEFLIFAAMGVLTLVLVHAVDAIAPPNVRVSRAVGRSIGVAAGLAWILTACLFLALYTSIGVALAEAAPDLGDQRAVIHGIHLVVGGFVQLSAMATAGWLAALGFWGRSAGVIGNGLAITAWIFAAAILTASLAVTITGGSLMFIPALLTFGVAFLLKSR